MLTRFAVVAVVGLTSSAFAGRAAAAEGREAREREARKACFTGNVDRGVEILVDLYGETGHPNYIYNQARCFERNGKYDQALLSYEDYLRKARDVGTAERAEVEKSITELRAKVGQVGASVHQRGRRPHRRRRARRRRRACSRRSWTRAGSSRLACRIHSKADHPSRPRSHGSGRPG